MASDEQRISVRFFGERCRSNVSESAARFVYIHGLLLTHLLHSARPEELYSSETAISCRQYCGHEVAAEPKRVKILMIAKAIAKLRVYAYRGIKRSSSLSTTRFQGQPRILLC